jgi:HEAT repeat protein
VKYLLLLLPLLFVTSVKAEEFALEDLITQLQNDVPTVRIEAAIALAKIGPEAIAAEPVLKEMLRGDDELNNALACGIIQGIGGRAVNLIDDISMLLPHENFHIQYWACRALGAIGPLAHRKALVLGPMMMNEEASVRKNAAMALGNIALGCSAEDFRLVIWWLEFAAENDRCHPVREAAKEALNKLQ